MTVGSRTVTVGGHYKDMTQESLADGMKINVDGHEITIGPISSTVDGKTQVLEPDQDVEITVDEKGAVVGEGGELRRRCRQRSAIAPRRRRSACG